MLLKAECLRAFYCFLVKFYSHKTSPQNLTYFCIRLWTRFYRDLDSKKKVSYFLMCVHMRNGLARLDGMSLFLNKISINREEDFSCRFAGVNLHVQRMRFLSQYKQISRDFS